jgi:hypothetical protein
MCIVVQSSLVHHRGVEWSEDKTKVEKCIARQISEVKCIQ